MAQLTFKQIAELEKVSIQTVKGWARKEHWPIADKVGSAFVFNLEKIPRFQIRDDPDLFICTDQAENKSTDEEHLEYYLNYQQAQRARTAAGFTEVILKETKPIGIAHIGDQHVGSHCWVDRMIEDAEIIRDTPGMYCILGGDGVDNYIKHQSAIINNTSRPINEWKAFRAYLKILHKKCLMMISGNHDAWIEDYTSINMVREIASFMKIQYSPNWRGLLRLNFKHNVKVDEDGNITEYLYEPYKILTAHKARGGTALNPGGACVKLVRGNNVDPDIDVAAVGHNHVGYVGSFEYGGRKRYAVRWSSYKINDGWALRHGFQEWNHATCPVIIYYPDQKKMVGFDNVKDAAIHLEAIR